MADVFSVAFGLEVTVRVFRRNRAIERVKDHAGLYHVTRCQRHFFQNVGHESIDMLKHYVKLHIADLKETHHRTHPREKDEEERQKGFEACGNK
ncbi:MAG: hypothetical protein RRC34_16920 [Lentisphaeria bacterium]|nr:hypothetical protein [Lentisphaeria bacterium]